ncbi:hypothetical protein DXG03_007202 [Asterophora parasitica]|uniref:Uncharacterized protein n=1 Tax=Asterophora parasitica TaxID=117018 RepID=A0A9P7G7N2_9AGAR|nr:hypothetical protein DXG03_007202 [Asterophora parasitica]
MATSNEPPNSKDKQGDRQDDLHAKQRGIPTSDNADERRRIHEVRRTSPVPWAVNNVLDAVERLRRKSLRNSPSNVHLHQESRPASPSHRSSETSPNQKPYHDTRFQFFSVSTAQSTGAVPQRVPCGIALRRPPRQQVGREPMEY